MIEDSRLESKSLGLMHFWAAGDAVTHTVAWILLAMSVLSWYLILARLLRVRRLRRVSQKAIDAFWSSPSIDAGITQLSRLDTDRIFVPLAEQARQSRQPAPANSLSGHLDAHERITRALREALHQASARLEAGQTLLASVGSTSPFVGLFGTVWGIYHALINIAASGQVQIDRIAGPVGEALIMTAAGLAVAIPAVLAYNAFNRINRLTLAELDGFTRDLFAWASQGHEAMTQRPAALPNAHPSASSLPSSGSAR
jgi:biopolymer transport protein ExbB